MFVKKSHSACFFSKHTLDFVCYRLLAGLAEMNTDNIGGLADGLAVGVGCVGGLIGRIGHSVHLIPPVNEKSQAGCVLTTKSGNGLQKTCKTPCLALYPIFLFFLIFSVAFVVRERKKII